MAEGLAAIRLARPGWWLSTVGPPLLLAGIGLVVVIHSVDSAARSLSVEFLTYERVLGALRRHLELVAASSLGALVVAFPLGALLARLRSARTEALIMKLLSVAQTVPSIAILGLSMGALGLGFRTAVFALWLHSLLPILHNTISGIRGVDQRIVEAAQGMGMRSDRIFLKVELPLATPVLMGGIRTAVVYNVGSAALATFVGAGGFGDLIVTGLTLNQMPILITGSALTALLAVAFDLLLGELQSLLNPHRTA